MKALVVVDYQNEHVIGSMGGKYAPMIENNICRRIEDTLMTRGDVYFVVDSFGEGIQLSVSGKKIQSSFNPKNGSGSELYGRVSDYVSKGYIIRKTTPGSDELMRKLTYYDEIELCGVETDVDVLANAVIAHTANPRATVIVRQNCVASRNSDLSEVALDIMNGLGIKVM